MKIALYDRERDRKACHRIWQECGWIGQDKNEIKAMEKSMLAGRALVGRLNGEAECLVLSAPSDLRYLDQTLPISVVTGVTTSRVGRKQGLAARTLAQSLAMTAEDGALVSSLGMFEQGFYDRLGYGTGSYERQITLDPATLRVPARHRVPSRISVSDWKQAHAARLVRWRGHGSLNLISGRITQSEMLWAAPEGFGLGYRDAKNGAISHYVWCSAKGEHGPYRLNWMAYRSREELVELLALIASLGDQVHSLTMAEPPHLQLQDLLDKPFKSRRISQRSPHALGMRASAWWQMRIMDLVGCMAHTRLPHPDLRFNLALKDPIEQCLPDDSPWRGVGGQYVVTLGERSEAVPGQHSNLPTLETTVNAFTRLWLGVLPATSLAVTYQLDAPDTLLAHLDRALRLPEPHVDWDC